MKRESDRISPDWAQDKFDDVKPMRISESLHQRFDQRSRNGVNLIVGGLILEGIGLSVHGIDSFVIDNFIKLQDFYRPLEGFGLGSLILGSALLAIGKNK